ncbi:MAG: nuclear transport factor 2 family protein, partial [Acidimicrobiales bacterium]
MPSNLETLQALYTALDAGDFATVVGLLPDGVAGHVPGTSQVAGEYQGKEAVAGYVGRLAELSGGTLRFAVHDVLASDGHGVALIRDRAERQGQELDMNNVHVWHVRAGVLGEIWIYPADLRAWDEFWG